MQDYLNVIYKASEDRARTLDHRPQMHPSMQVHPSMQMHPSMHPNMHPNMHTGYFIYCPNQLPDPIQIPNNPIMHHEPTPTSQAIRSKRYSESYDKNKNENDRPSKIAKKDPNYISKSGFYNKISEILGELPKYQKIFVDNQEYFKDMLRPRENISLLFEEITEDLNILKTKNYDICKYANNCTRRECCAFLNPDEILKIINAYKYFDIDVYDFKHYKKVWKASIALKSLKTLHNATWYIVSRKRLANKIILEK